MTALRALLLACAALLGPPAAADGLAARALEFANASRAEAGLPDLARSRVLDEAARVHAEDMLARGYYAHVTPEGRTARDRYEAAGGARWAASAENIARCRGCATPPGPERVEAFHEGWMRSPGHRANILSPGHERFGFAIAGADGETYAVQTFAGPGVADGAAIAPDALRTALREKVGARRAAAGGGAVTSDPALDAAAEAALDAVIEDGALPGDPFALLPADAPGWTSLELRASVRGGAGRELAEGDAAAFAEAMAAEADGPLGGRTATHLGVAVRADGRGRKAAVAVFGAR